MMKLRPSLRTTSTPQHLAGAELALQAQRQLVDLRILQARVDDVDPGGARAGQDEPRERIRQRRRKRRNAAGGRIDEEDVARTYLDGQGAAVETALERLNLQGDAIVVEAVAAAHARASIGGRPVEANARAQVVRVTPARAADERQHDAD